MTTTGNNFVDYRLATESISLPRRNHDWSFMAEMASDWLEEQKQILFPDKEFFAILSDDYPREDNRISHYRKISKLQNFHKVYGEATKILGESFLTVPNGVIYYGVLWFPERVSPYLVEEIGMSRNSFVFFADKNLNAVRLLSEIKELREQSKSKIDNEELIQFLIMFGISPVRTWGTHDDLEMHIEIY